RSRGHRAQPERPAPPPPKPSSGTDRCEANAVGRNGVRPLDSAQRCSCKRWDEGSDPCNGAGGLTPATQCIDKADRALSAGRYQTRNETLAMTASTLFAKIWDSHVVADLGDNAYLLHVDRHLLHDLGGSRGLLDLKRRGIK